MASPVAVISGRRNTSWSPNTCGGSDELVDEVAPDVDRRSTSATAPSFSRRAGVTGHRPAARRRAPRARGRRRGPSIAWKAATGLLEQVGAERSHASAPRPTGSRRAKRSGPSVATTSIARAPGSPISLTTSISISSPAVGGRVATPHAGSAAPSPSVLLRTTTMSCPCPAHVSPPRHSGLRRILRAHGPLAFPFLSRPPLPCRPLLPTAALRMVLVTVEDRTGAQRRPRAPRSGRPRALAGRDVMNPCMLIPAPRLRHSPVGGRRPASSLLFAGVGTTVPLVLPHRGRIARVHVDAEISSLAVNAFCSMSCRGPCQHRPPPPPTPRLQVRCSPALSVLVPVRQ